MNMCRLASLGSLLLLSLPIGAAGARSDDAKIRALRAEAMEQTRQGILDMLASFGGDAEIDELLQDFRSEVRHRLGEQRSNGERTFRIGNNDFGKSITVSAIKPEWTNSYPDGSREVVAREAIIDFDRKLKALGIDLIVIPRPAKIEVYPHEFDTPLPAGIPISVPRLREMLALLDADVEVVEVLPTLQAALTEDDELPMYETTGHHISGYGVRLVGKQVAERLARYKLTGRDYERFTDVKQLAGERITPSVPMWAWSVMDRGQPYAHVPDSEVVIIGDSNAFAYKTASWASHIAHYSGIAVTDISTSSGAPVAHVRLASQGMAMLKKRRVVVWIISCTHMERRGWPIAELVEDPSFSGVLMGGDVGEIVRNFREHEGDKGALGVDEDDVNDLGYEELRAKRVDNAVALFSINTEAFPYSANAFDSLGEAYVAAGAKKEAIAAFQRALQLSPNDTTRENSIKLLAQLGVEAVLPPPHTLTAAEMEALVGTYEIPDENPAVVRVEAGTVTVAVQGQPKVSLRPIADTFFGTDVGFTIEFKAPSNGSPMQIVIIGKGDRYVGSRVL